MDNAPAKSPRPAADPADRIAQPTTEPVADVIVVGAGPAGLMAAIAAAEAGRRVALCEQLDRPGVKLLATGGGRCNLTHNLPPEQLAERLGPQGRFAMPALTGLDPQHLRRFFSELGVPTICPDGRHVYPASQKALTVQSALWRRARQVGVSIRTGFRVERISPDALGLAASAADGRVAGRSLVLTTGGKGYPELGGAGVGYELARQLSHTVTPLHPALVGLVVEPWWLGDCAGLSVAARVWIDLPRQSKAGLAGDVLITHRGLSGPAVLDLSGQVATLLAQRQAAVPLRIELLAGHDAQWWTRRLAQWRQSEGAKLLHNLVGQFLPDRLARAICARAGAATARAATLGRSEHDALVTLLARLPVEVGSTEGFARAMVTRGGVTLKEVDPHTLASRLRPGLFFAGELLDLAGPCGGFNLQWAFSSGRLAGLSAARWLDARDAG